MPQSVVAWLEDEDRSGAETGLAAITDSTIFTTGDSLRLSSKMPKIAMLYAWTEFAAYEVAAMRLAAPSLGQNPIRFNRGFALEYIGTKGIVYDFRHSPLDRITPGDLITAYGYEDDEAGVAHYLGIAAIVCNAPIPKGPAPKITHIHRCTGGAATAATWSALTLTETDTLPAGKYKMFGARVEAATALAARFIFNEYTESRPAVIPVRSSDNELHPFSEYWGKGIEFTMPNGLPQLEILDTTTSTSVIELYLQKVS